MNRKDVSSVAERQIKRRLAHGDNAQHLMRVYQVSAQVIYLLRLELLMEKKGK